MSDNVSYIKEAIKEPLNIWALVGCVAASVYAATAGPSGWFDLSWIPLAAGAAAETLYLSTVPAGAKWRSAGAGGKS